MSDKVTLFFSNTAFLFELNHLNNSAQKDAAKLSINSENRRMDF